MSLSSENLKDSIKDESNNIDNTSKSVEIK